MVDSTHQPSIYYKQLYDCIMTIEEFIGDLSPDEFIGDKKTFHACLILLVHIWEIISKMKKYHIDLPIPDHQKIVDMRNFLAHQYIEIRPSLVRRTIFEDIPQLKSIIIALLD